MKYSISVINKLCSRRSLGLQSCNDGWKGRKAGRLSDSQCDMGEWNLRMITMNKTAS
ncbi:hypothetical protein T02_1513 [Trichinella nativa]|uniref:Uncharacterized protein n=2 Tax=Trichinella TaxID=6333 RepID=A0A0V1KK12_9BILA|nr:hypothetical protein T03_17555 [Trichinella britovi]KRZ47600.1 hypothetical protein T02_1513 [Trichinella nativa]